MNSYNFHNIQNILFILMSAVQEDMIMNSSTWTAPEFSEGPGWIRAESRRTDSLVGNSVRVLSVLATENQDGTWRRSAVRENFIEPKGKDEVLADIAVPYVRVEGIRELHDMGDGTPQWIISRVCSRAILSYQGANVLFRFSFDQGGLLPENQEEFSRLPLAVQSAMNEFLMDLEMSFEEVLPVELEKIHVPLEVHGVPSVEYSQFLGDGNEEEHTMFLLGEPRSL
jgi:hypothetical protein